jgi:hypothetical protein
MDGLLPPFRHGQYLDGQARGDNRWELQELEIVRYNVVVAGLLLPIFALCLASAGAMNLTLPQEQLYTAVEIPPPTDAEMTVCYSFVCRKRLVLDFTKPEQATLLNIMAKGKASPADERKAIQQAFLWFDQRVARDIGTDKRVAYADFHMFDSDHNFDCWDTTRNAQSFLLVLQEWGALRHHTVSDPRFRGNLFVGQTPHNTAVIKEKVGGESWIVDMWTTSYGQVPDVMTLAKWMDEK